jgi:putative ABC transport system ATP-binding protein
MAPALRFPLETQDVTLRRGGRVVLTDVNVRFERASVTAIVGPSGAGKSSLLRCLNRLEEPDSGCVLLDGRDVREMEPTLLRQRVGMIFQTPVLFPGGVRANLAYGLPSISDDVLEDALGAAGLGPSFLERESPALSVGQAQRVSIARALVRAPEVILMDEPTSALDKNAAQKIESLLGNLTQRGLAVVLVTHDLAQARRVSQHTILFVDGRVRTQGDVDLVEGQWPEGVS